MLWGQVEIYSAFAYANNQCNAARFRTALHTLSSLSLRSHSASLHYYAADRAIRLCPVIPSNAFFTTAFIRASLSSFVSFAGSKTFASASGSFFAVAFFLMLCPLLLPLPHHDVGSVVELCGFGLSVGSALLDKLPVFIFHIAVSQPLKTEVCAVFKATFAPCSLFTPV